jgi:hypothetical protein
VEFSYSELKDRQRMIRHSFPESLSLRTHRALSWLRRAEMEGEDMDARYLFLWVAFNAAYANEIPNRADFSERRLLFGFLNRLVECDKEQLLYNMVWRQFSESIRVLINNRYVFQPFWDYQNARLTEEEWEKRFEQSKRMAKTALGCMDTKRVFAVMFDRLYVLRNQLVHGGSTWNSAVNRGQISDGAKILDSVVPIIVHLMMENPNQLWGDPCYPVIKP